MTMFSWGLRVTSNCIMLLDSVRPVDGIRIAICLLTALVVQASKADAEDYQVQFTAAVEFAQVAGESLKLNLARPVDSIGPLATIVCIHGGGFSGGRREDYDDLCRKFAARGYVAATIDYRLAPKHLWPAHIHD